MGVVVSCVHLRYCCVEMAEWIELIFWTQALCVSLTIHCAIMNSCISKNILSLAFLETLDFKKYCYGTLTITASVVISQLIACLSLSVIGKNK